MKILLTAAALAALATVAQAGEPRLIKASGQTTLATDARGDVYVVQGKSYPRVREVWVAPDGWTQRVYVVGEAVPDTIYKIPKYQVDWRALNLPAPKGDEKWIRIGPDAVLLRVGSGNVIMRVENVYY